ncbi:hypothetical protein LENED_002140 [Lentinula edodes]|uniref:Uncharacterized protein n=1 Tax=Lentinula edodes TaxID=5353 RepID=A0A1Q3E0B6_LENED|nr:hypothetical protein LENED_002140 [Lentinula edodes]
MNLTSFIFILSFCRNFLGIKSEVEKEIPEIEYMPGLFVHKASFNHQASVFAELLLQMRVPTRDGFSSTQESTEGSVSLINSIIYTFIVAA